MINKGKGCITAIFDGSIPIGIIKHGLDTIFQKPSEEPLPEGYVTDGIYANYSGYDCEGGTTWVDSVNGNDITMYKSPEFDANTHSWTFKQSSKQYGKADLTVPTDDFTVEVYGLVPNATSNSRLMALLGHTWSYNKGYGVALLVDSNKMATYINTAGNGNGVNYELLAEGLLGANLKTKIVMRRSKNNGILNQCVITANGKKQSDESTATGSITPYQNALMLSIKKSGSSTTSDFVNGSYFAIRIYNRYLTDAEIAQNHAEDVKLYGE